MERFFQLASKIETGLEEQMEYGEENQIKAYDNDLSDSGDKVVIDFS